jgi:fumarylpyruvate hydrolase
MADYLFEPPAVFAVPVHGEPALYPVRRVFCVGRNYASHAAEMGAEVDRAAPFYFTKSVASLAHSGVTAAYPPGTSDFHFEMELVVALGAAVFRSTAQQAQAAVFGYACGLDMTRRDLQAIAKEKRQPWDIGKDVEQSAVVSTITPAAVVGEIGPQRIALSVNGVTRQDARLSDMIHSVPAIVRHLSGYYHLGPGDLIFTGTPAGVGAVGPGDVLEGTIDGLSPVRATIGVPD